MTPTLNELRFNTAAFEARARRARSEAMYNLFVRLLKRLGSRADESLGRPQHFGQGQWG